MNGSAQPRRPSRRESAGVLLYRGQGPALAVLLVHPSGWYNRKAPWSLPKGLPEEGESMEQAAIRETLEETGVTIAGPLVPLDLVTYKGGKRVHGFCAPCPAGGVPWCASWEVDRAEFFPLDQARQLLHPSQQAFLDRLEQYLRDSIGDGAIGGTPT